MWHNVLWCDWSHADMWFLCFSPGGTGCSPGNCRFCLSNFGRMSKKWKFEKETKAQKDSFECHFNVLQWVMFCCLDHDPSKRNFSLGCCCQTNILTPNLFRILSKKKVANHMTFLTRLTLSSKRNFSLESFEMFLVGPFHVVHVPWFNFGLELSSTWWVWSHQKTHLNLNRASLSSLCP